MSFTRSRNSQSARKRLADFVQKRLHELDMSDDDLMRAMGIPNRLALKLRLNGKATFRMDDCQRLAAVLCCDERELVFLHLAQFHSEEVIRLLVTTIQGDTGTADAELSRPRVLVYERLSLQLPAD